MFARSTHSIASFLDVFGVSNHVHNWDSSGMELLDNLLRWHTNGCNKKSGFAGNNYVNQVRQLSVCVIVVGLSSLDQQMEEGTGLWKSLPSSSSDLWQE